jgi:L-threonylcarbamoyladenylate synthase
MIERLVASDGGVERAAELLRNGGLIAFPTDTVYGLGCRADAVGALARLFAAKRRPPDKAVPWLVSGLAQVEALGYRVDERARALAARFWPGGLTLVLAGRPDGSRAFRAPDHPLAQALIALAGPLATSSANRSGEPETLDADEVQVAFADADEVISVLDGGPAPGGQASSVVALDGPRPRLVREGAVPRAALEAVVGPLD